jgi:DNA-binding beta-propeller fold protein YncE
VSAPQPPFVPEPPAGTMRVPQPPAPKRPGRQRFLILGALSVLLLCSLYLWVTYLTTRQAITQTLPVPQVAAEAIKPHYLFSIYNVAEPVGIAVSPDGTRIYVGESGGQRLIRAFDKDGKQLASFTAPGAQSGTSAPVSLSLDDHGRLYVADSLRHMIDIYDAGGNFIHSIQPPIEGGWVPVGVQVDGQTLLVAGANQSTEGIIALSLDGQLQFQLGKHGEVATGDGFYEPNKAVTDALRRIYISDSMNQRVAVFDSGRKFLYSIPGFNLPRGMAVDRDQKLYVVDTIDQMVKVYDVSGAQAKYLFDFGDFGVGNGQFSYPNDISLDGTGRLYITDRVNNRVQVWAY